MLTGRVHFMFTHLSYSFTHKVIIFGASHHPCWTHKLTYPQFLLGNPTDTRRVIKTWIDSPIISVSFPVNTEKLTLTIGISFTINA